MSESLTDKNENIVWHSYAVNKHIRAELKGQKPVVLWFTGLSGAGKSTIAGALEKRLTELHYHTYLLDGDNVRHGLCSDLGFSAQDRRENIRRVGELSALMADAGLIVLTAFISPHRSERESVRTLLGDGEFIEVFVNTELSVCEQRDPKGLYKKARAGDIRNFTGIDATYEVPDHPELDLPAGDKSVGELVEMCLTYLREKGVISRR